jgi:beta-lactamase class A
MHSSASAISDDLQRLFGEAGCDGFLCARDLDRDETIELNADEIVISASVFKVLVHWPSSTSRRWVS